MRKLKKNIAIAILCFLLICVLNFFLPRLLPGDPVAYLTGFSEESMTSVQIAHYREMLHLDESLPVQFAYYVRSLLDGTLGYSYKKNEVVATLILRRLPYTLMITIPSLILSTAAGLILGLAFGMKKGKTSDNVATTAFLVLNTVPTFLIALMLMIFFCFRYRLFPYTGINSPGIESGTIAYSLDRLRHLFLPVLTLTLAQLPSRYLLIRNMTAQIMEEKHILYARERGLSDRKIRLSYILPNIVSPFITMVGMSFGSAIGGSLIIENIFSINGMGMLMSEAVYSLDYPLLQGILYVTTATMTICVILTDGICVAVDPRARKREDV